MEINNTRRSFAPASGKGWDLIWENKALPRCLQSALNLLPDGFSPASQILFCVHPIPGIPTIPTLLPNRKTSAQVGGLSGNQGILMGSLQAGTEGDCTPNPTHPHASLQHQGGEHKPRAVPAPGNRAQRQLQLHLGQISTCQGDVPRNGSCWSGKKGKMEFVLPCPCYCSHTACEGPVLRKILWIGFQT